MRRYVLILIICVSSRLTDETAFAQCGSGGFRSGFGNGFVGTGGGGQTNPFDVQAQVRRRHAFYANQIRQTAQRQAAASNARFQRYVAAKTAYRNRVLAEAAALSKQPRFSRREQLRQRMLDRNRQRQQERISRDAEHLLAKDTYNGR